MLYAGEKNDEIPTPPKGLYLWPRKEAAMKTHLHSCPKKGTDDLIGLTLITAIIGVQISCD